MKKFKWTVEFTVDETWIADGFNLTEDAAKEMIEARLPYSDFSETKAKVISKPRNSDLAKAQGYKSVAAFLKDSR